MAPPPLGVLYSCGAALFHSAIDVSRKHGAEKAALSTTELVAFTLLFDCFLLTACCVVFRGKVWLHDAYLMSNNRTFLTSTITSAILKMSSSLLYQQAVKVSPLSQTVPYLAFTPVFLLAVAYFVVGEVPTANGIVGVAVVALGAFALNYSHATTDGSGGGKRGEPTGQRAAAANANANANANAATPAANAPVAFAVTSAPSPAPSPAKPSTSSPSPSVYKHVSQSGSCLMLLVAAMWSLTSALDKKAINHAPSELAFATAQRYCMLLPALCLLYAMSPGKPVRVADVELAGGSASKPLPLGYHVAKPFFALVKPSSVVAVLLISCSEVLTVLCYLLALEYLFVSYVVAIKRTSMIISVIAGGICFGEELWRYMPCIAAIIFGEALILFW